MLAGRKSTSCLLATLLLVAARALADGRPPVGLHTAEAEADRVLALPGWGRVNGFDLFAGYITVHEKKQRRLFYTFAACEADPANAPIILWLNGGPGCSSVGGGFLTELGPWYPRQNGSLEPNPYSWNKFANVLFVEAPAFVGFSYSRDYRDGDVGDKRTASDNLAFLLGFFERFPSFASNRLWVSGESYAGHYVPQLAVQIIRHNSCRAQLQAAGSHADGQQQQGQGQQEQQQGQGDGQDSTSCDSLYEAGQTRGPHLRLEGLSLGNAWTDPLLDNRGTVDHWWTHSMISDASFDSIKRYCDFARSNPLDPHPDHQHPETDSEHCDVWCHHADQEIGHVDIYDMDADDCLPARARGEAVTLGRALAQARSRAGLGLQLAASKGTEAAVALLRNRTAAGWRGRAGSGSGSGSGSDNGGHEIVATAELPSSRRQLRVAQGRVQGTGLPQGRQQQPGQQQEGQQREGQQREGQQRAGQQVQPEQRDLRQYEPCVEDFAEDYLNRPQVQAALHANQSEHKVPWRWVFCKSADLRYRIEDLQTSMLPLYDQILTLAPGLRILLYSGDADATVPALGTRYWLKQLGLREKGVSWRTWSSSTGQVAGYVTQYEELTFAVVRAAGHMVPYSQPERAHFLISHFIRDKELPS